jgi:hypothetical protein
VLGPALGTNPALTPREGGSTQQRGPRRPSAYGLKEALAAQHSHLAVPHAALHKYGSLRVFSHCCILEHFADRYGDSRGGDLVHPRSAWRNCPKRGSKALARYSAEHEKSIPHRPLRIRMDLLITASSHPAGYWPTSDSQSTGDTECHLLHHPQRMCLASTPARLPTLEDRSSLLQDLANRRYVGALKHSTAGTLAGTAREKPLSQRWDSRFAVGQDDWSRRGAKRLRRWQEGQMPKATPAGGYGRAGAQG